MLKKFDGTPYSLRRANPAMDGQSVWDGFISYNLENYEVFSYFPKSLKIKKIEKREEPVKEIVVIEPSSPATPVLITPQDTEKMKCWVLPTETRITVDTVYGEEIKRIVWGKKFQIDVSIEDINGLRCVLSTNDISSINRSSIMFVDGQHWKVENTSKENDILLIKCVASDQTPSFG